MYLTPERQVWLRKFTVEQANNQFHVIDLVETMTRMDREAKEIWQIEKELADEYAELYGITHATV